VPLFFSFLKKMPLAYEELVEGNIYWGHVPNNINFIGSLSVNPTPISTPTSASPLTPTLTPLNSDRHLFLLLRKVDSQLGLITIAVFSSFGDSPLEEIMTSLSPQQLQNILLPSSATTPDHRTDGEPPLVTIPPFISPPAHSYLILQSSLMEVTHKRKVREKTKPISTSVSLVDLNRVCSLIRSLVAGSGGGGDDRDDSDNDLVNMRYVQKFKMDVYPAV
jgi:hypothetical protein